MANNNHRIKVELDFSADTKAAKSAIQELSKSLNSISEGKFSGIGDVLAKDLQEGQKAAAQLKAILNESFNVDTGKLDLGRFQQAMKKANTNLNSLRYNLQGLGPVGVDTFINLSRSITMAEIPVFRLNDKIKKLGATFANTMRWQISSSVLNMMVGAVQNAFQYAQDLNESLTNIRIVTGYSAEAMDEFASHANKAAKALSTTTNEYAKASLIYFQQGLSDAEVEKRTATTIKLANVTGESAETVSEWMTAVWNNFDDGSKALEHYADVMTALGAATASSSDEIAGGLEKFAAIAKTIGLSYEYAASALATVTAVTRQSEDVVGTAFKTIFGRMEGLELGQTLDDGVTLNKYSEALSSVGVQILDVNGELKDMDTILNDLGGRWDSLSQGQKVALAQVVGGMRQYNQLIALMDNWEYFQENLTTATNSSGELNRQADIYAESWQAASDKVQATLEEMYNKLLNDDTFVDLINGFADFLELINDAIDSIGGLKGVLFALGAVLTSVFSDKIIKSLSTMSLNFQTMTKKGRERIQQMKQEAYDQAAQSIHDSSPAMSARITAVVQEAKLEDAFQKKLSKQSEIQQAIYRAEIETLKVRMKKNTELGESVDLLKKEADQQKKNFQQALSKKGQHSHFTTLGSALENFDGSGTEDANAKNAKILEGLKGISNKNTIAKKTVKELQDALTAGTLSIEQFEKGIQKIYRALSKDLSKSDRYKDEVKEIDAALDNATNATNDYIQANKELEAELEKTAKATNDLEQEMNDLKLPPLTWEETLVGIANAAMQAGMAISALSSIGDTLTNDELSGWEKLEQILMSLSMLVPSLVSIFKAFNSERWEQVTATWAQVAAEAALKKVQGNGDLDLKNNFRKNEDGSWDFITKDKKGKQTASRVTDKTQLDQLNKGEYSNIKLTKNQSGQVFGGGKIGNFKAAFKGGAGKMMGGAALIAAGIAVAAGTIYGAYKFINKEKEEAEVARKGAQYLSQALTTAKQNYEDLKSSISSYKEGVDGLKKLTKGTLEYSDAITKANDEALNLIKNNKNLKYSWNSDGLIEIDSESLKVAQEEELKKTQQLQAASLQRDAIAMREEQELKEQDYQRRIGSRAGSTAAGGAVGLAGGLASGALIGAGIGTLGGPIGWVAGAIIGGIVGVVSGAITGAVVGEATEQEEKALDQLQNTYEHLMETQGNADILKTKEGIKEALKGFDAGIVKSLTENVEATYELIESNHQLLEQERLATRSRVEAYSTSEKIANSKYKDYIYELKTSQIINGNDEKIKEYEKTVRDELKKEHGTVRWQDVTDNSTFYAELLRALEGEDAKLAKGETGVEGQYKFSWTGGGDLDLEVYKDGKWDKILKNYSWNEAIYKMATNRYIKAIEKNEDELLKDARSFESKLIKLGIKEEDKRLSVMLEAAKSKDQKTLTSLSMLNEEAIKALQKDGYNVETALKNRETTLKMLYEDQSKYTQPYYDQLVSSIAEELSEDQIRIINETINKVFESGGVNGLQSMTSFLSKYSKEEQAKLAEVIQSFDFTVIDPAIAFAQSVEKLEGFNIQIDESDTGFQSFIKNMQESAFAGAALGNTLENISKQTVKVIETLGNLKLGDVLNLEKYEELLTFFPTLENFVIRDIKGYSLINSGENILNNFLDSRLQQMKTAVSSSYEASKDFAHLKDRGDILDFLTNSDFTSAGEVAQKAALKLSPWLTDDILYALNFTREELDSLDVENNQEDINKFNDLLKQLTKYTKSGGSDLLDDNIYYTISTIRERFPNISSENLLNYLTKYYKINEQDAINYVKSLEPDIKLDNWNYFIEDVLNGVEMEASKENLEDLDKSLSKLNDQAFSSAEALDNLSLQMEEIANQNQLITANLPTYLTTDEIAALGKKGAEEYYEQLKTTENVLEENKEALEEIYKTMADQVLKAFQDWNEEFAKINSKAEYFQSIVDNYKSIVNLTREFTKMDSSILKQLGDTSERIAKTQMVNAKNNYEALMVSRAKIVDEMNYAIEQDLGGLGYYWWKQLDEIDQMIQEAHTNYLESWNSALQAAADNYKSHIEEIMNDFEKSMTGAFGSYDSLLEHYDQQKKLSQQYLADYEKAYELSKLIRQLDSSIDETDSLKNKAQLRDLQKQINKLSESDTKLSQYQLEYLQKQYDLTLAQIALEEAQEAKHQVRLQRTASGSWGYVYTADDNKINEAQQNYEDKLFNLQKLSQEYIQQMQESYLQIEAEYVEQIKAIYNSDATEEEKEEAIKNANAFYQESMQYYVDQLNIATEHNKQTYLDDADNYLANVDKKDLANKGLVASTNSDLADIEKRFEDFRNKLGDFGSLDSETESFNTTAEDSLFGQLGKAYYNYRTSANAILGLAGTDFSDLGATIAEVIGDPGDSKTGASGTGINGELTELEYESDKTFSNMTNDITELATNLSTQIPSIISKYNSLINILERVRAQAEATAKQIRDMNAAQAGDTSNPVSTPSHGAQAKEEMVEVEKEQVSIEKMERVGTVSAPGGQKNLTKKTGKVNKQTKTINNIIYVNYGGEDWYKASDIGTHFDHSVKIYHVKNGTNIYKLIADSNTFDTGGYTGAWGPEGRLAMLHQKELILNAKDTENFLSAIGILRSIVEMIDLRAAATAFNNSSLRSQTVQAQAQTLEQQVTIHAEFPNVKDHYEIEEALNNIVNTASQYANRKI